LSADVRIPREIARQGTLTGWQTAVEAALTAPDCPHWTLGVAGGFVGPLVQLCGFDTCGMNYSGPSSCGKTLSQQLAVSVWTCPRLTSGGLLRPANFTTNSIELVARQSNGTVLGLDELALIDGRTFGQVIYGLAAGVGKARMTVGLKLQRSIKWSTFVVLSCERTLEQKIKSDGGRWSGGMAARFADIDCSDVDRRVPAKTITAIDAMHYGEAGIAFIRRFMAEDLHRDPDALRQRIVMMANTIAGGDVAGAQVRAALPFALLHICGELARAFGVLPKTADIKGRSSGHGTDLPDRRERGHSNRKSGPRPICGDTSPNTAISQSKRPSLASWMRTTTATPSAGMTTRPSISRSTASPMPPAVCSANARSAACWRSGNCSPVTRRAG
jgi:hypothetical protein